MSNAVLETPPAPEAPVESFTVTLIIRRFDPDVDTEPRWQDFDVELYPTDRILDAARAVFEQYGARRANVDDIATAAGVSRSTLYRRFATKDDLLAAVVLRETDAFLADLEDVAADLPPQEAVIECFTRGLRIMRDIPVLGRLAKSEPEAVTVIAGGEHVLLSQSDRIAATLKDAEDALERMTGGGGPRLVGDIGRRQDLSEVLTALMLARLEQANDTAEQSERLVQEMRATWSWRFTKPFRAAARAVRRLTGK